MKTHQEKLSLQIGFEFFLKQITMQKIILFLALILSDEQQHLEKFEKARRKINMHYLYLVLILLAFPFCKISQNTNLLKSGNKTTVLVDNKRINGVTIDSLSIEISYYEKIDSIDLIINLINLKTIPIWVGVTSVNVTCQDDNIIETILPDLNLNENIILIDLKKGYSLPIIKNRFKKFNTYEFTFYLVNDWVKFIQCVSKKEEIKRYKNEIGQDVWQLPNDKIPEEGITIVTLYNISNAKNISEILCKVANY